ncbi:hypothetical protein GCM10009639_09550 [Kitasatospora putterlickiae]|uniref:Uncharacterized protein n=1 Tax=Kitasatospora putterlickiae TaxID=221725 RepID=A0ABN1XNS4_9ACTN
MTLTAVQADRQISGGWLLCRSFAECDRAEVGWQVLDGRSGCCPALCPRRAGGCPAFVESGHRRAARAGGGERATGGARASGGTDQPHMPAGHGSGRTDKRVKRQVAGWDAARAAAS